jgi:hypothetical protein
MRYSDEYIHHLIQGPFPNQVDPFAESGRYFQQLHSEIISHLLGQLQNPLLAMGYIAGRETSLQIAEQRQPDIYVQRQTHEPTQSRQIWSYSQAAASVLAEPGLKFEGSEPELDALHIKELETGRLVTIIEIVSPRNKTELSLIEDYQERRTRLLQREVNIVEVDLTRSVKRLVHDVLVDTYPYHVAVLLYDQTPRLIGIEYSAALKRCAIPLRAEVIPVELQAAYDHAYKQTSIAGHIQTETQYRIDALPFPSLLTPDQHKAILDTVKNWQAELKRLQEIGS